MRFELDERHLEHLEQIEPSMSITMLFDAFRDKMKDNNAFRESEFQTNDRRHWNLLIR